MKYCIPAIIMTFLIAAPFGLDIVIEKYISINLPKLVTYKKENSHNQPREVTKFKNSDIKKTQI